tara:strand:- start:74 stop:403 length:330 start_codon:yes stop_codon:yes gene_type:complete
MEDIGKLLKHPLVIIVAVLLAALVFYNIASPYKNCVKNYVELHSRPTVPIQASSSARDTQKPKSEFEKIYDEIAKDPVYSSKDANQIAPSLAKLEKIGASYCSRKGHSW